MNQRERDIQRKLRILKHAEETGQAAGTCRYFGVARDSFYRWKALYKKDGEAGLINKKPIPKNSTNRTPPEVVEKVLLNSPEFPRHLAGSVFAVSQILQVSMAETNCARRRHKSVPVWLIKKGGDALGSVCLV